MERRPPKRRAAADASITHSTQVRAHAAVDQAPESRGHRLCVGGATKPALGASGRRRGRRRGPRALRRRVGAVVPVRRPRGRRVQGPGHRTGRYRARRLTGGRRGPRARRPVPARERLFGHVELGEAGHARAQGSDSRGPEGPPRGVRGGTQEVRRRGPAAGLLVGRGPRSASLLL